MNEYNRIDTDLLRFIAIVFITNSHLDVLYPIKEMGVGGSIGNSFFFMLSGYGLWVSHQKNKLSLLNWYGRRILRIYPTFFLVTLVFAVIYDGAWNQWLVSDYIEHMFWPNYYWFISAMMVFYVFMYVLLQFGIKAIFIAAVFLIFGYIYYYNQLDLSIFIIESAGYFKWLFYAGMMLLGCFLAFYKKQLLVFMELRKTIGILFFTLVLYGVLKIIIHKGISTEFQFLLHLLTFPIVVFSFRIFADEKIKQWALSNVLTPAFVFVGSLALEIYLIQGYIYVNDNLQKIIFPFNVIVFWLFVIVLAYIIKQLAGFIRDCIPSR